MKFLRVLVISALAGACLFSAVYLYFTEYADPSTARELLEHPDGERAQKVMLLTLPSGRMIPVNYLREADKVFAGADGGWWRELSGEAHSVTVLIKGDRLHGLGRTVEDDPVYIETIFKRLRPDSYRWIGGVLVEIQLDQAK